MLESFLNCLNYRNIWHTGPNTFLATNTLFQDGALLERKVKLVWEVSLLKSFYELVKFKLFGWLDIQFEQSLDKYIKIYCTRFGEIPSFDLPDRPRFDLPPWIKDVLKRQDLVKAQIWPSSDPGQFSFPMSRVIHPLREKQLIITNNLGKKKKTFAKRQAPAPHMGHFPQDEENERNVSF